MEKTIIWNDLVGGFKVLPHLRVLHLKKDFLKWVKNSEGTTGYQKHALVLWIASCTFPKRQFFRISQFAIILPRRKFCIRFNLNLSWNDLANNRPCLMNTNLFWFTSKITSGPWEIFKGIDKVDKRWNWCCIYLKTIFHFAKCSWTGIVSN